MTQQTTVIIDLEKEVIPIAGPIIYQSGAVDLDRASGSFCAQMTVKNAVGAEFKMSAQVSVDGKDYVTVFEEDLTVISGNITAPITAADGYTSLFDFASGSGAGFLRLKLEVVTGTMDLVRVMVKAKESR